MIIRPLHFFFKTYFRRFIREHTPLLNRQNFFTYKTLKLILTNRHVLERALFQRCADLLLALGNLGLRCSAHLDHTFINSPKTFNEWQCFYFAAGYVGLHIPAIPRWVSPSRDVLGKMNDPHVLIKASFLAFGLDEAVYYFFHKRIFCLE